jgi:hypothetical protein
MTAHSEAYEHLGEVKTWVQDMHPIWEKKRTNTQVGIPPEQVLLQVHVEINLPPELVWDYLSRPESRKVVQGSDRIDLSNLASGRISEGSEYRCYHGDQVVRQTILEWLPFERMVSLDLLPVPFPNTTCLTEYRLEPTSTGTSLYKSYSKARGPLAGRVMANAYIKNNARQTLKGVEYFKEYVEYDYAGRTAQPAS